MADNAILDALVDSLQERMASRTGYKHDLPAGFTLTTNQMHGPTGVFGTLGADRDVFSSRVVPRGLLSVLPSFGTVDTNPVVYYLTGMTDESGSEPSAPCAECIKAGEIKGCRQGTAFGLVCRETDEMDISSVGRRVNRGEMYDLRLVNDPLLNSDAMWVPPGVPKAFQSVLNREVLARWLTLGVAFENKLADLIWTGNPLNNVGTGYAEYSGLELLVATGHTDVIDSTSCPSLDSDIKDFQWKSVEDNAAELFWYLTWLTRYVKHNAETMNFNPVEWVWVMKDSLFRQISDYWPCVYASARCNATANDVLNGVSGLEMKRMADEMYNGRYLQIDGMRIPVVLDDAIPVQDNTNQAGLNPGEFASDIYLLPLSVAGGKNVTFMEYFDYSATNGVMQAVSDGRLTNDYWTDGGRWLWTSSRTRYCVNWNAKIEPRLRLLTPHLAGRLENVKWQPLQAFREPFPSQGYFVDGGITTGDNAQYSRQ